MKSIRTRITISAIIISIIAVLLGAFLLRPNGNFTKISGGLDAISGSEYVSGEVLEITDQDCQGYEIGADPSQVSGGNCDVLRVLITSGDKKGSEGLVEFDYANAGVDLKTGTKMQLLRIPETEFPEDTYLYMDLNRSNLLIWIAIIFAIVTIIIGRWRGIGAIVGLILTFIVLLYFMFPALLEGKDPLAVAVVAASGLVLILLYTAHGLSIKTSVAVLGTLFGIALTATISFLVVGVGNFSGISSDDDFLLAGVTQIRLDGLLLAGIIFASVGVLNDVTVTQASAIWELKESQPNYSAKELFVSGMRIGRDHIASTVYTLLFTYAGAALPTLLLIVLADRPTGFIISSEAISQEIVRTLVGSIGLVLAVPITTILAAVLAEKKN
jgi:uncharacterized membrane protein